MEDINTAPSATSADAIKALMLLRAEMVQREARMSMAIGEQVQALRQEVGQFRRNVAAIIDGAGTRIAEDAREAVSPVAMEYGRAVSGASTQLRTACKVVWVWLGAAAGILVLVLVAGWMVVGYYGRELAATKEELQRYEDAVPVVQAFYASDAIVCGGLICTNADPRGARAGDKGQYRAARKR